MRPLSALVAFVLAVPFAVTVSAAPTDYVYVDPEGGMAGTSLLPFTHIENVTVVPQSQSISLNMTTSAPFPDVPGYAVYELMDFTGGGWDVGEVTVALVGPHVGSAWMTVTSSDGSFVTEDLSATYDASTATMHVDIDNGPLSGTLHHVVYRLIVDPCERLCIGPGESPVSDRFPREGYAPDVG